MDRERIFALDVIRGIAIIIMVIVHRVHYHWFGMSSGEALRSQMAGWRGPLIVLVIMFFTMAGVFYVLSGSANALSKHRRVRAAGGQTRGMIAAGLGQGAFLLGLYYVYRVFLANGFVGAPGGADPVYPVGLLNGWLRNAGPVPVRWHLLTTPGTLSLVGLSTISLTLVLAFLLRGGGSARTRRNCLVLGTLGCAVLLSYPLLNGPVDAAFDRARADGRFGAALLLGHLTQTYGLFPNLGFVFLGAVTGLALAAAGPRPILLQRMKRGGIWSLGLAVAGVGLLAASGRGVSRGSGTTGGLAALAGLGLYVLFETWGLRLFDAAPREERDRRLAWTLRLRRLGRFSLTIYVLEPLLAEGLNVGLGAVVGPAWSRSLPAVLAMGVLCVAAWNAILGIWQKLAFVGSLEWLLSRLVERLTGARSSRLDLADLSSPLTGMTPGTTVET